MQRISPADVAKLLRQLQEQGLSPWTCHGVLTLMGALFAHAVYPMVLIAASPTRGLTAKQKPKQQNKQEIRKLNHGDVAKLIEGAWPTWRRS